MVEVNCPSCHEKMDIDDISWDVEWECPTCEAAFRVQKDDAGSLRFHVVSRAPSTAIQPDTKQHKGMSRKRRRNRTSTAAQQDGEPDLNISLAPPLPLQDRFPEMQPGNPPPLFTFNGIGTTMYGSRDFDPATGTYVASACLVFIFVPIFIIGAYRVADAQSTGWFSGSSWHVLGRVPLSPLARGWNLIMGGLIIMLFFVFMLSGK